MSNPITVTVSESNVTAGASVTVTVLNAAPASGAGKTVVSAGGIADLTTEQQAEVSQGVIVVTTDGYRYVYSGTGSKTNPASYVVLADITPDWSTLSGKPTSFTPATHAAAHAAAGADPLTVSISQVTGLQTALDGKQPSGSYAPASHVHAVSDVTGLQTELSGKASTGHVHAITDVTNLQSELNGKAAASHVHGISDVTGLQTALDGKAPAAVEWTANHTVADGTRYEIGDLVYSDGNVYRAIAANESIPVSSTSYWALVGAGYRLNIDGRDIQNIPDELPASATDGDVLTYSSGSWVAAAPSGGGGGGAALPTTSTEGTIAVYDAAGSAWTTGGDSMNLDEVVLASYGAGSGNKLIATFGPVGGASPGLRAVDSGAATYMELNSNGLAFPDGSEQATAAIPLPTQTGVTGDVLTLQSNGLWEPAAPSGGGGGGYTAPLYARSTMDESQMSVSASTGLTLSPIAGSATYYIEGLAVIEGQADAAIGLKLSAGTSDGEVLLDHDYLHDAQNNEWSSSRNTDQTNSTAAYNNGNSWMSTVTAPIRFRGWVTTGAISSTNIALHFGSTSNMATITLKAGSWIMATKVA